jgi:glucosamine--fructose-6-phosphate aminotransferase (isomerizing)
MCGIFGVSSVSVDAGAVVLNGLKRLEYRGYDSWGITVLDENSTISTKKGVGKISQVKQGFPKGSVAIGHTRWATHGGVTKQNAHPHTVGSVTLVHNGIVENFEVLKKRLQKQYTFKTQTDSEVVAALIDHFLKKHKSAKTALRRAAREIEGRFALVVLFAGDRHLYAVRRGSPLIIGRAKDAVYTASDIPAFLEYTRTVNYLDDGQMAVIDGLTVTFLELKNGTRVKKRNIAVPWRTEGAEKGEWPHFMIKEIFEQKDTILRALAHADTDISAFVRALRNAKGIYFIGSGTAHKAAMAGEYFFARIANRKVNVVPATEMPAFENFIRKGTALVAVSQSGETADVLEVLEHGKRRGAHILSITNTPSSSIARMSEIHLPINSGPEKAVASTKAMTAQMALLLLCAYADGAGKNVKPGINKGRTILQNTAANINDMLNPRYAKHVEHIAKKMRRQNNLFIIGRGPLYPIALEAAIKIQEVSYIHAHGFAAGELKHGPIALIEKGTPCIVLGDDPETIANAIELRARGATIVGIAETRPGVFDFWIRVPDCNSAQAIVSVIPVQLLAYYLARARKLDPDMPRNLAKSVTVK